MEISKNEVRNPLTIIALFASIAEASATVASVLSPSTQHVFVWFVMGFPTLLVLLFFAVLVFKRESLYAPSDFSNEERFMDLLKPVRKIVPSVLAGEVEKAMRAPGSKERNLEIEKAASSASRATMAVLQKWRKDSFGTGYSASGDIRVSGTAADLELVRKATPSAARIAEMIRKIAESEAKKAVDSAKDSNDKPKQTGK